MTIVKVAEFIGTVSIFFIFLLKFWIAINPLSSMRLLRIAILWTTMYIFFLFFLRLFQLVNFGTEDELRIVGGFTAVIPLVGIVIQLYLDRKLEVKNAIMSEIKKEVNKT